ncbi:MAG: hypothetical protein AAGA87_13890 [Pseudomonadota bacterium]
MIRAALILALLASPAAAQTQGTLKAGDALRQCLQGSNRPLGNPEQFLGGLATADNFGWVATEFAPGKHRLDRKDAAFGITLEIQTTDAQGTAYCIAYGPALQPGDAVAAVDRAMAQGLMPSVTRRVEPAPQGTARYYVTQEGPVSYALLAYRKPEVGDIAGFVISGLPTAAPAQQQPQAQSPAAANFALAAELCLRPGIPGAQRAQMFRQAGFSERVERSTGNSDTTHYFTAPGNSATAQLYYGEMPSDCFATSGSVGASQATAILDGLMPRFYPSYIRKPTQGPGGATCVTYEQPGTPIPHVIGVAAEGGAQSCAENGTSRIYGFYAV